VHDGAEWIAPGDARRGDDVRRAVLDAVRAAPDALTRDDVAHALGVPRSTAAFHLEALAAQGVIATHSARRSGRTGPGAGRPSKLYTVEPGRHDPETEARRYDVLSGILATASDGLTGSDGLDMAARAAGVALATGRTTESALSRGGFEPSESGDGVQLLNCPFREVALAHPDLVCGINLELIRGIVAEDDRFTVEFRPGVAGRCCVELRSTLPG
jgi:predicted ArsR family transcriptional regulator